MTLSRREALGAAIALPLATQSARAASPAASAIALPDRTAFAATPLAYLDNAATHPISLAGRAAIDAQVAARTLDPVAAARPPVDRTKVIASFARLVNADPDEITWVQSTTMGEQAVLRAMGFPQNGGRIVTDTLHFYAAFPMYVEMGKQGVDVAWVQAREGRIAMEDMARAITPGTKLVCVSQVSTYNGFQHDLKAICDLAHRVGALVYADIIHAAGAVPVDLHGSGVDFAASATYKWLMGDFGLGFLYARRGVADHLPRTEYGYYGFAAPDAPPGGVTLSPPLTHAYPLDPPPPATASAAPVSYSIRTGAIGHFGTGTYSSTVIAQLAHSLPYIEAIGIPAIQAHAQSLIGPLREGLRAKGYRIITPPGTATPILSCVMPGASAQLTEPLRKAQVRIALHDHHFRISPSLYNDAADIDRLLAALPRV